MVFNHGINAYKSGATMQGTKKTTSGIAFFIGAAPCHMGEGYVGKPQIVYSFDDAKKKLGYSEDWRAADGTPHYTLCEPFFAYFKLMGVSPIIVMNVFDPKKHKETVTDEVVTVKDHAAVLSSDVIIDGDLKVTSGGAVLVLGTDHNVYRDTDGAVIIELISTGTAYSSGDLKVSYNKADPTKVKKSDIEAAVEQVEYCKSLFGIVPDLIAAPGYGSDVTVASVLAAKAPNISGLFKAKAVVTLECDGVSGLLAAKNAGFTDENMIVCYPYAKNGERVFELSTLVCARMAATDADNGGVPFESPSNKEIPITALCDKAGKEIVISLAEADAISSTYGIVTAVNSDGFVAWGNRMACSTRSTDVSEIFIPTSRMVDYVCNTFVNTYWAKLDKPLTSVYIDSICDSFNAWLAGLVSEGKLIGGKVEYIADNNQAADLLAGSFRLDVSMASPVPAEQINVHFSFDADMLTSALSV